MGYTPRKDIHEGFPKPHEQQFTLRDPICPIMSTKHKHYPEVKLGSFSARAPLWGADADIDYQTPVKDIVSR